MVGGVSMSHPHRAGARLSRAAWRHRAATADRVGAARSAENALSPTGRYAGSSKRVGRLCNVSTQEISTQRRRGAERAGNCEFGITSISAARTGRLRPPLQPPPIREQCVDVLHTYLYHVGARVRIETLTKPNICSAIPYLKTEVRKAGGNGGWEFACDDCGYEALLWPGFRRLGNREKDRIPRCESRPGLTEGAGR